MKMSFVVTLMSEPVEGNQLMRRDGAGGGFANI